MLLPGILKSAAKEVTRTWGNATFSSEHAGYVDKDAPEAGMWMFHGSPPASADLIKEQGLKPQQAREHNLAYRTLLAVSGRRQRTSTQKASVHLTPSLRYARVYGKIDEGYKKVPGNANVFATFVDKKQVAAGTVKEKAPELSGAFGYHIVADAYLHRGEIPPGRLHHISLDDGYEKGMLRSRVDTLRGMDVEPSTEHLNRLDHLINDKDSAKRRAHLVKSAAGARTAEVVAALKQVATTPPKKEHLRGWTRHAALNAGQAVRDAGAGARKDALKSAIFAALPPTHHTANEMRTVLSKGHRDWYRIGKAP